MHPKNVDRLLERLKPEDLVLDVGGWACPFNRAQWVLDAEPFETRGFYRTFGGTPFQGGEKEWFTAATWVCRDFCEKTPWPFADKQFDFVVCSHTLEDIRDPLQVCAEMIRVGRAGYIEVPSRLFESCRGIERPGLAGLSHHRWIVDLAGDKLCFVQKSPLMHVDWRLALPQRFKSRLTAENSVLCYWWTDKFEFEERNDRGRDLEPELISFAQQHSPRPRWRYQADALWRRGRTFSERVKRVLRRVFK